MNSTTNLDLKKLLRKKFTATEAVLIGVNLIPLIGVWIWHWDAREMFLVYCLESVIAGIYTIMQMLVVSFYKKQDVWNEDTNTKMPGLFFIFFFIVHFGLFLFVQMSIFLSLMNFPGLSDFGSAFTFLLHFPRYLSNDALLVLISFLFSYGITVTQNFFLNGFYKTASLGILMFTPYPRIFVQQFVVILGSFVLIFGSGATKIFMLIFVAVKIFFELVLDFDGYFRNMKFEKAETANVNIQEERSN